MGLILGLGLRTGTGVGVGSLPLLGSQCFRLLGFNGCQHKVGTFYVLRIRIGSGSGSGSGNGIWKCKIAQELNSIDLLLGVNV